MPTQASIVYALRTLKLISALNGKEATTEKKTNIRRRFGGGELDPREGSRYQCFRKPNSRVHTGAEGLSSGVKCF